MAYTTYLIKAGGTEIPLSYIFTNSYDVTPNQRLETSAERNTSGVLSRETVSHTPSKVEFDTRPMYEADKNTLMAIITGAYTDANARQLTLDYYCPDTGSYQTGTFYVPDIKFTILSVINNNPLYDKIRIAFIEY